MALAYHFDLYPRTDPVNGVRVARLTGLLEQLYRGEANGTGSGRFAVRASSATGALLNPLGLEYVRVVRDDGATEKVVGGFWTERGTYQVVNRKRTRRLTVGGAGTLAYLARAVMAHESYLTVPFIGSDPFDDTWRLYAAGTGNELGAILWRVIAELQEAGRPRDPIPGVVMTFDYNTDTNGVPWSRSSGDFTAQVGDSVLDVVRRLMQLGLYVELDPDTFELNAYEPGTHERDRTGLAWASSVVRLQVSGDGTEEDGNILNESERGVEALVRRSDLLVGAQDVYAWVTDPAADMVWEGAYRVEDESGASFTAIGQAQLDARADQADPGRVRLKLGSAPTAGEYLPFETTGVLADDLVTVDSGAGTWDWDESTQRVAALTIQRRRGGDWTLVADLGTRFASMEERAFRATPVGPHTHKPNPMLCDPAIECSALASGDLDAATATNGTAENGAGTEWSGGAYSTAMYHGGARSYGAVGVAGAEVEYAFGAQSFTAGTRYVLDGWRRQTSDHDATTIRFGVAGGDEEVTTYQGIPGNDPADLWEESSTGADGQTWHRFRVCWTPNETTSSVRVRIEASAFATGDFAIDDLALYTTDNNPLAGSVFRAARCDHGHHARDIPFQPTETNPETNVQAAIERAGTMGGDHGDAPDLDVPEHHPWALRDTGHHDRINRILAAGPTPTLDLALGTVQDVELSEAATLALTGATDGVMCRMDVVLRGEEDVTWPASVTWIVGSAPTPGTDGYALHAIPLWTIDGGDTWYAANVAGVEASAGVWHPVMTQDPSDSKWYVVVDGDGTAVMAEAP